MDAYLAVPKVKGRVPAVIYLHGAGEGRERFVLPATWAAGRRAVGMTLTLPSSSVAEASGLSPQESLARQRRIFVDDVVAVRRAIDVLRARPEVDPNRIGLVGWSLGARVGAVTAGVDPRLKAVVLMSGGASPVATYVAQAPAALRPQVRTVLTALDPLRWIAPHQGAGPARGRPQGRGRPAGGARRPSEGGPQGNGGQVVSDRP